MKILLFAMRVKHKKFFLNLRKESPDSFDIVHTRDILSVSLKGYRDIKKVDFTSAIDFAIEEFLVKTNLKIPKVLLKFYFRKMAVLTYFRYYRFIDKKYDYILLWNGGKYRQLIALEIARIHKVKPLFYENGLLPNRIVLDRKGINFENSVPRNRAFFEAYTNLQELPQTLIPRKAKNIEKFQEIGETLPKNFIFVPFQVDSDTQIITNSKWVKNMRVLFSLIEKLSLSCNYNFVLKEHPSSSKNYPDLHKKTKKMKSISFANGYSTQELIEKSLAVITINSTVGIESLLFKKRVMVLGDAFYTIDGITKGITSYQILLDTIKNLDDWKFEEKLVENFLKYLFYDYLIPNDENIYKNFFKFIKGELS